MSLQLRKFLHKIPAGVGSLFFIQIFSTLAYSVLYSSLVLFAVQALHLPAKVANSIIATFVAFNFALHLVGGFLGGRVLSFRNLFFLGMILQTIGCLLIAKVNIHFLYFGMAFFLVGSGLNVPCMNCMLSQLFEPEDKLREMAFLWNYSGMNIGFFTGFTVAGIYQLTQSFHALFILTSMSNLVAMLVVLMNWQKLHDVKTHLTEPGVSRKLRALVGFFTIALLIVSLRYILMYATLSSEVVTMLGVVMAVVIFVLAVTRKKRTERNKMYAYYIFALAALTFFVLYQLAPMALTLFLQRNVDRYVYGFQIPTQWFLNIDSIIVIIGCPLLSYFMHRFRSKGYNVNTPFLFAIGIMLIGIAMVILPVGIHFANAKGFVSPRWILLSYILLACGEVALSPIGYAVVGELAPIKLRGLLMGTWLMTVGVAATISKIFSNIALGKKQAISPIITNPGYSHTFLFLGLTAIVVSFVLYALKPLLLRLMYGQ